MNGLKQETSGLKKTQQITKDNGTALWEVAISPNKPYNLTMTYLEPVTLAEEQTKLTYILSVQNIMLKRGANH